MRRTVTVLNRETGVYVQRKVRVVDETLPQLLRVPKDPLPLSWGRTVKPYVNRGEAAAVAVEDSQLVREEYITHMDFGKLKRKETYLGVLINPDWAVEDNEAGGDRLQCLRKVPLAKLCPTGFIFIWIEKRDVQNVCDWMYKQNYAYVENLTWVQMLSNNKMVHDESKYMRKSHLTLYIFRKQNEGKEKSQWQPRQRHRHLCPHVRLSQPRQPSAGSTASSSFCEIWLAWPWPLA